MTSFHPQDHVEHLEYNGKKVFCAYYSQCKTPEELLMLLRYVAEVYREAPAPLLGFGDFTGLKGNPEFMNEAKRLNAEIIDAKTERAAAIGITGLKKVLLMGYNLIAKKKMEPFDTREQALEFLTK